MRNAFALTRRAVLATLALAAPLAAQAGTAYADPALIDRAVERFTGAPIGVAGGAAQPVDRRLRLAACRAPLALGWHGTRQDTVKVECPDPGSWRIFVALARDPAATAVAAKPEMVVQRGDAVSIVVRGQGFSVSQAGEAMEAGAQGDWIRVKPPGKSDAVRGRIERPGLVVIPL